MIVSEEDAWNLRYVLPFRSANKNWMMLTVLSPVPCIYAGVTLTQPEM